MYDHCYIVDRDEERKKLTTEPPYRPFPSPYRGYILSNISQPTLCKLEGTSVPIILTKKKEKKR